MLANSSDRRSGLIQLNDHARQHPLFSMMDYIARSEYKQTENIAQIKAEVKELGRKVNAVSEAVKELHSLVEKFGSQTFDLEKCGYKVYCIYNYIYTCNYKSIMTFFHS